MFAREINQWELIADLSHDDQLLHYLHLLVTLSGDDLVKINAVAQRVAVKVSSIPTKLIETSPCGYEIEFLNESACHGIDFESDKVGFLGENVSEVGFVSKGIRIIHDIGEQKILTDMDLRLEVAQVAGNISGDDFDFVGPLPQTGFENRNGSESLLLLILMFQELSLARPWTVRYLLLI